MSGLEQSSKQSSAWSHLIGLGVVLLVAALLRLWNIGRESLWTDEALTIVLANWPVGEMIFYPADETPFLYYALHKFLVPVGAGAVAVRGIPALAGLLSVLAMYFLGRLALGPRAGLLCAALLAVWTYHVDYSQEARAYSLLFLLTTVSAASLIWWFRETEPGDASKRPGIPKRHMALAIFAVSTTLTFYTHLLSIIWIALALQILLSLTSRTRSHRSLYEVLTAMGVMALLASPGALRLFRKLTVPDAFHWLPQATPREFVQTTVDVLLPLGLWMNPKISGSGWALPFKALVVALLASAIVLLLRKLWIRRADCSASELPVVMIAAAFLSLPLIIWLFGYVIRPVFMPRTILFAIPGMVLLVAASINAERDRRARNALSLSAVGLFLLSTLLHGTVRNKEDWRGANAFLARHAKPGDLLFACPVWKFPAFRHAAVSPLSAPVLTPIGSSLQLLERNYGSEKRWAASFFANVTSDNRVLFGAAQSADPLMGRLAAPAGTTFWLVESECDAESEALVTSWAKAANSWEDVWQGTGPSFRDHIKIRRARLTETLVREVRLNGRASR